MSNLLLRVRRDALQRNLLKVREMVEIVKSNGAAVRELQRLLRVEGNFVWTGVVSAKLLLDNMNELTKFDDEFLRSLKRHDGLEDRLTSARNALQRAATDLTVVHLILDQLSGSVDETHQLLQRQNIRATFEKQVDDLLGEVQALEIERGPDDDGLREQWTAFSGLAERASQTLFRDYVEVASGVTLRGTGLDEQFCAMADHLGDSWSTVVDLSDGFAIPAGAEAEPLQRIIRLGFPEWTIWSLPLFAHVFGQRLVGDRRVLQNAAARVVDRRKRAAGQKGRDLQALAARVQTYMADACATAVMGPAYACAGLLLKLDPTRDSSPGKKVASDRTRSEVILATIDRLGGADLGTATGEVARQLRSSWEALSAATAGTRSWDGALVDDLVDEASRGLDQIRAGRTEPALFRDDRWVAARNLGKFLLSEATGPGFSVEPGTDAAAQKEQRVLAALPADVDLVHVLNAAWYSRLSQPAPPLSAVEVVERLVRTVIWPRLKPPRDAASNLPFQPPRVGDQPNSPRV